MSNGFRTDIFEVFGVFGVFWRFLGLLGTFWDGCGRGVS